VIFVTERRDLAEVTSKIVLWVSGKKVAFLGIKSWFGPSAYARKKSVILSNWIEIGEFEIRAIGDWKPSACGVMVARPSKCQ